jgi:hypothetical protein
LGRLSERNSEGLVIACGSKHTVELWNKQGLTIIFLPRPLKGRSESAQNSPIYIFLKHLKGWKSDTLLKSN